MLFLIYNCFIYEVSPNSISVRLMPVALCIKSNAVHIYLVFLRYYLAYAGSVILLLSNTSVVYLYTEKINVTSSKIRKIIESR